MKNPFEVTQAVDFSNSDIEANWVDLPGGYLGLVRPTSPMPIYILGGKGSGKTHLMRYLSFDLQLLRHLSVTPLEAVAEDGYVAVFLRCDGLNAGRFQGKGQGQDVWQDVFAYYFDLWLATTTLAKFDLLIGKDQSTQVERRELVMGVTRLLRSASPPNEQSLEGLVRWLADLQASADVAIDNAALTRELSVPILATRGDLVFGIPRLLVNTVSALQHLKVIYLIDELESLEEWQQKYINSLVRDRQSPTSFRVGSRLYGLRTVATYSANEELKVGSEYEKVHLDAKLRSDKSSYAEFCRELVLKRLFHAGIRVGPVDNEGMSMLLDKYFESFGDDLLAVRETCEVVGKQSPSERPYFKRLRRQLQEAQRGMAGLDERQVNTILGRLEFPEYPLLEKVAILTIYSDWAAGRDLILAAQRIRDEAEAVLTDPAVMNQVASRLRHFGRDMVAQMYRDFRRDVNYSGFDVLIAMSMGIPRNLLILLKYAFQWAIFRGEKPFSNGAISIGAQNAAVREASNWFFDDSRATGASGEATHAAVSRLGTLLKGLRYSDKPAECSVSGVSIRTENLSPDAAAVLQDCVQMSVLIENERGQKDRNSPRVDDKYLLNFMLCPRWDLPVASRGVLPISKELANAILDPREADKFDDLMRARLRPMNAPFGREGSKQQMLPGMA